MSGVESPPGDLACEQCLAEFDSLKVTLQLTRMAIEKATPRKERWQSYAATLRQKLDEEPQTPAIVNQRSRANWLRRCLTASIRVPVPVGVAVVLLCVASIVFALQRTNKRDVAQPVAERVSVVRIPVEVPVVQERVVTQVVYRRSSKPRTSVAKPDDSSIARSQPNPISPNPISLSEFKPLEEVKFKIIKGGSPDEK